MTIRGIRSQDEDAAAEGVRPMETRLNKNIRLTQRLRKQKTFG